MIDLGLLESVLTFSRTQLGRLEICLGILWNADALVLTRHPLATCGVERLKCGRSETRSESQRLRTKKKVKHLNNFCILIMCRNDNILDVLG